MAAAARALALASILLAACTYRVDSTVDAPDADPGDFRCERAIPEGSLTTGDDGGLCTLRAAIMEANAWGFGQDRIELPAGEYALALPSEAGGGALEITSSVRIQGSGPESTIVDAGAQHSVFMIFDGDVGMHHLTIRNGKNQYGGGVWLGAGSLELDGVIVRENVGFTGAGGLYIGPEATATIRRSAILENSTDGAFGGGFWNQGETFVVDTTVANNQSNRAGGIRNDGVLQLRNTTVSGNVATSREAGTGGLAQADFAFLNNVTIVGNTGVGNDPATSLGGGLMTTGNATTVVKNSIIAGNDGGLGPNDCFGPLTLDSRYNLIGDTEGCGLPGSTATFILDVDPELGPLSDNGGFGPTHEPLAGSPVLGAGFPLLPGGPAADACQATDQRGVPRPEGGDECDLGAVEVTAAAGFVSGFVLVDADADVDLRPLHDGDVLDLSELPPSLSVRAAIDGTAGSVVFAFNDDPDFRTENVAPYALGGDSAGDYAALNLPGGTSTLTATPFAEAGGAGAAGGSLTILFEVD